MIMSLPLTINLLFLLHYVLAQFNIITHIHVSIIVVLIKLIISWPGLQTDVRTHISYCHQTYDLILILMFICVGTNIRIISAKYFFTFFIGSLTYFALYFLATYQPQGDPYFCAIYEVAILFSTASCVTPSFMYAFGSVYSIAFILEDVGLLSK